MESCEDGSGDPSGPCTRPGHATLGTPLYMLVQPSGMLAALHAYGSELWALNGHCVTLKWAQNYF